jgi:PAS domain S-box-containing protein
MASSIQQYFNGHVSRTVVLTTLLLSFMSFFGMSVAAAVLGRIDYDWRVRPLSTLTSPDLLWGVEQRLLENATLRGNDAVVAVENATFWELHAWRVVAVISLCLIETALIVLLLANWVKRRRAERSLRESEERLSLATAAADVGVWMWDVARDQVWATANWRRMFGFAPEAALAFETVIQRIHPNDRPVVIRTMKHALEGGGDYASEYRIVRAEGTRWIAAQGRLDCAGGRKRRRMLGASVDITERKRAEQAAHELSGRLISAQEEERARLAKELHDGLSQNLALLAVELELFGQRPTGALDEVSERMQEFSTRAKELSSEVHRLSHGLHPAKLEQLGLAAALGGFCRELEAGGLISVKFSCYDVSRALPKDLALCLYRVTQEALQNVVKHSGARNATVELRKEANELQLRIADDGKGFDATAEPPAGTLGLVSMRSRVRLVGGNISWDSTPGQGTRVNVRAPVTVGVAA